MSPSKYEDEAQAELVDDVDSIHECLANLYPEGKARSPESGSIAVDLEGVNLGRTGRASIMQVYASKSKKIWIVDITTLGKKAFDEKDEHGHSLRGMLEDRGIKKIFYDVRNDSDALYSHFGVRLQGVFDLQILELLHRYLSGARTTHLNGLVRTMNNYNVTSSDWKAVKEAGVRLFAPEKGGSYEVFERRPLDPRILAYCAQDVALLPDLETAILRRIGFVSGALSARRAAQTRLVEEESAARVVDSQSVGYNPNPGRVAALARVNFRNRGV